MATVVETSGDAAPVTPLRDGRYLGSNGRWWCEARVDGAGSMRFSADLHAVGAGGKVVEASVQTTGRLTDEGAWELAWFGVVQDGDKVEARTAPGWLAVHPAPAGAGEHELTFHLDDKLGSLTSGSIVVRVARVGDALRELGVEIEYEAGVAPLGGVDLGDDGRMDLATCLRGAGIHVHAVGRETAIPQPDGGTWDGAAVLTKLHKAMAGAADASLDAPAWEAHLLMLSRAGKGVSGLMFDIRTGSGDLPRQGAAIFTQEIRDSLPAEDAERRILQTVVHELGHVLNLRHPWPDGGWDSTTPMNYPSMFHGGGHAEQYEKDFRWEFDDVERDFLRHAPRPHVIPGGDAFGVHAYRPDAEAARVTEADLSNLRLWLTPAGEVDADGRASLLLGQPPYFTVSLGNAGDQPVVVPRKALDVKAGALDILVSRVGGDEAVPFRPVVRRCYDVDRTALVRLGRGQSLHDNVNLTFGATGSPFRQPGEYVLQPVLEIGTGRPGDEGRVQRVPGVELRVVVTADDDTAADASVLHAHGPGLAQALGSLELPTGGGDELTAVLDRRLGRAGDPIVAAIHRLVGIDAGRRGRKTEAAKALRLAVDDDAPPAFDPLTAEQTRRLADEYDARTAAPTVVVDLTVDGAPYRVAGALQVDGEGVGYGVLAPATTLPGTLLDEGTVVAAAVTVVGKDGVIEHLPAPRVEVVSSDTGPEALMVWLPRPIPGEPTAAPALTPHPRGTGTLWQDWVDAGLVPPDIEGSERATTVGAAARQALQTLPERLRLPASAATVVPDNPVSFAETAGIFCRLLRNCGGPLLVNDGTTPYPFDGRHPYEP